MKFRLLLLLLLSVISASASAGELSFSGELVYDAAFQVDDSEIQKQQLLSINDVDYYFNGGASVSARVNLNYDIDNRLHRDYDSVFTYSDASKPYYFDNGWADLRELYVDIPLNGHFLRLGKQHVAWGATDGLRVLDIVNPVDYKEFVLAPFEESRIPTWMINYSHRFDQYTAQLLIIPDQTLSFVPNGAFMPTSPLVSPTINPSRAATFENEHPDELRGETDVALRVGRSFSGHDVNLVIARQTDKDYVYRREATSEGVTYRPYAPRSNIYGASYSTAMGDYVLRSELAYSTDKAYFTQSNEGNGIDLARTANYGIALDWYGASDSVITFQLFQDIILESANNLYQDKTETTWSLNLSKDLLNQRYVVEAMIMQNLNRQDGFTSFNIRHNFSDSVTLKAGFDYFFGDTDGLFGQFSDKDRLTFAAHYTF